LKSGALVLRWMNERRRIVLIEYSTDKTLSVHFTVQGKILHV
jgi:hypothetical protein